MEAVFLRWIWWRAALHRGWWLVTSVYLVVDAGLTPTQLVTIGVAQAAVALGCEVPAGVFADTVSRKWSLVLSQVLMGAAMLATGLVTDFAAVLATQMLWGLAWTFASGAEVAWITDELTFAATASSVTAASSTAGPAGPAAPPDRIAAVLARAGRADLTGAVTGMVVLGALAAPVGRATAMVLAGAVAVLLAAYIIVRFPERRFVPAPGPHWRAAATVLVDGLRLTRRSRVLLVLLLATFLVNGAFNAAGRLLARRLVDLGFPAEPLVLYTGLSVLALLAGVLALTLVVRRVDRPRTVRLGYAGACAAGALGVAGLAAAPDPVTGAAASLLITGIAGPLTRTFATIRVNAEAADAVRATVHSFLAQAEYAGVIVCGTLVAAVAGSVTLPATLGACAALFAVAAALTVRDVHKACG